MIFDFIETLFNSVWGLFSLEYPGTGMSFLTIGVGAMIVAFSLSLLGNIVGVHFSLGGFLSGLRGQSAQKGGNNKSIKISNDRKGDTR